MIGPLLGMLIPGAIAYWALAPAPWTRAQPWARLLVASLGMGLSAGVTSCLWLTWRISVGQPGAAYFALESTFLLAVAGCARVFAGRGANGWLAAGASPSRTATAHIRTGPVRFAIPVVVALVLTWFVSFAVTTHMRPHGSWDAVSIWNLHARLLTADDDQWREFLRQGPRCAWQADYPLLIPAAVARLVSLGGATDGAAGALVAFWFAVATALLCGAIVGHLRGATQALLAVATLLGTSAFVRNSASQYADLPLAWFIMAALGCFVLYEHSGHTARRWLLAAGLATGLAAWTKNEGLLFAAVVALTRASVWVRRDNLRAAFREMRLLACGVVPVLLLEAHFKLTFAPVGYLLADQGGSATLSRLLDPMRYLTIAGGLAKAFFLLTRGFIVALPAYALLMGPTGAPRTRTSARFVLFVLALMVMGFAGVYLVTPLPLHWQLKTSARRLLLQLWPAAVMAFFLVTANPEERLEPRPSGTQ